MNSSGAELLRPFPSEPRASARNAEARMCATLQRARAAGVKRLEDCRAPSEARGPEGRPAPRPQALTAKTGWPKAVFREIMTTLGVKLLHNFARNQATIFAAS